MAKYKTPGVYVEEMPGIPHAIAQEPTSVAVFIGYTENIIDSDGNDIIFKPCLVKSFANFTTIFGNNPGAGYLYDAVFLFYKNGGETSYIISAGSQNDTASLQTLSTCLNVSKQVPAQLLVIPDGCLLQAHDLSLLQQDMLQCCADLQDRFAILDTPMPSTDLVIDIENFRTGIGNVNLQWGAAYYPSLIIQNNKAVPPSGAIAGIFAQTDKRRGVWKAPANISVNAIHSLTVSINDSQQEGMNVHVAGGKSVNAIRLFTGRGILVWGARTLAGIDNEWRYISVRRFVMNIEQSISKSTLWVVFEPNDANTWVKLNTVISNYLVQQWRSGALQGSKPEEAFFVKTGLGTTMVAADIASGIMITEIGLATVRPAEFIIIRLRYKMP
ncbi:MAG: phage tail sheath C-terminal domain-containing protein [Ferruginibacter sp.]